MINLNLKYEKRIVELMVDQKFIWSTLTLTDFDQNDHFAPFDQLKLFHSKLNFNPSIIDAQYHIEAHGIKFESKICITPD